ncbi:hypothetical protein FIBSPDRAFT_877192 [Athelia psychrophila]|uniref:Uncharacterized protein n=1 Tax=Athelia psychrophila TaxID=1759441 RepID=A0A167W6D7_9AGAM|nr:hypothetical protein FIBSPDRAFT_877192 [Fibularhizoctonia sp. CBS 109695]
MLHKDGLLASSSFFNRGFHSRNTSQLLLSKAPDIAARHPAIAVDISAALESEPALASVSSPEQFDASIVQRSAFTPPEGRSADPGEH